jgi:hypothetical protein
VGCASYCAVEWKASLQPSCTHTPPPTHTHPTPACTTPTQGTFAKVYKARCIDDGPHLNEQVAIKTLKLEAFMTSLDDIIVRVQCARPRVAWLYWQWFGVLWPQSLSTLSCCSCC